MFSRFTGGARVAGAAEGWPVAKVAAALEALGEDGPLKVFGVQDNGVNFVVALIQSAPESGKVVEFGFLARFVGFELSEMLIETINRNLHMAMVSLEGPELFLMAGLEVTGPYDQGRFMLLLEAWRRDLMVTLHGLSGAQASMAAAFPAARLEAARDFAVNVAPAPADNRPIDMLASFLGEKAAKAICEECHGRGKRGFIARVCGDCAGTGFVSGRRSR